MTVQVKRGKEKAAGMHQGVPKEEATKANIEAPKDSSIAQQLAADQRNRRKRRSKDDVSLGTLTGQRFGKGRREQPKFNNGMRDRVLKQ
jgi:hypothetical protein